MKNLAMSQVMAGVNTWDAPGHTMAGSNDIKTRAEIFSWIAQHEKTLYAPREPLHPVGVYFSPKSRNYDVTGFLPSYRGTLLLLLQQHVEFQVVTPRTLEQFAGTTLVLPNVTVLDDTEKAQLRKFSSGGGRLVVTGADATALIGSNITKFEKCPAKDYFDQVQKDFNSASTHFPEAFLSSMGVNQELTVDAPATVVTNIASVNGHPHIFIANFTGLVPHKVVIPSAVKGIKISTTIANAGTLRVLPFLGTPQSVTGRRIGDRMVFELPSLERGAVVWLEEADKVH